MNDDPLAGATLEDLFHLARAIQLYRERSRTAGRSQAAGLLRIERAVAARAMQGHTGSVSADPAGTADAVSSEALLLTYAQVSARLNISLSTVKRRVKAGDLDVVRDHGVVRVQVTSVQNFIDRKTSSQC